MPAVAFTDPELASVGMTVAEAKGESKQKATNSHLLVTAVQSL